MAKFDQQEDPHKKKEQLDPQAHARDEAEKARHGLHGTFMDHLKDLQNSASKAVGKVHPGEMLQQGKQPIEHNAGSAGAVAEKAAHGKTGAVGAIADQAAHGKSSAVGAIADQAAHGKAGLAAAAGEQVVHKTGAGKALDKVTHSQAAHEASQVVGKGLNHPAVHEASKAIDKINENPAMKTINKTLDKIPGHELIEMGSPIGWIHQGIRHKKDIEKAAGALKQHIDNGSQTSDASGEHKKKH